MNASRRKEVMEEPRRGAFFREAFEHAPIGVGVLSREGDWVKANKALLGILGYTLTDLLGRPLIETIHAEDAARDVARIGQLLAGEASAFSLEQRLVRRDGELVEVSMNLAPVRNAEGRLTALIAQVLDITESKRAARELRAAKELSENIIRSSSDGIVAFDRKGLITVWNTGMERMTGMPARDAIGKRTEIVLPFVATGHDARLLRQVLSGHRLQTGERPFSLPATDRHGYYEGSFSPLHDSKGGIIGGAAVIRDVTEAREHRERQRKLREELEQRNRELQDFAYVASHDLQEPLRKIRAFGERLQSESAGSLSERGRDYLQRMCGAAVRMQKLIEDLISYSRIGTQFLPFEPVDLNDIVGDALSVLEARIEETGARIEVSALPTIEADPVQMCQLFQNLLGNALKYIRPGVRPEIRIRASAVELPGKHDARRPAHLIEIEDNGIGFDEKFLDRIFTVFQRLHGREEYEGTGIGLAICKKIVERHQGTLSARSQSDAGSTFLVTLPDSNQP